MAKKKPAVAKVVTGKVVKQNKKTKKQPPAPKTKPPPKQNPQQKAKAKPAKPKKTAPKKPPPKVKKPPPKKSKGKKVAQAKAAVKADNVEEVETQLKRRSGAHVVESGLDCEDDSRTENSTSGDSVEVCANTDIDPEAGKIAQQLENLEIAVQEEVIEEMIPMEELNNVVTLECVTVGVDESSCESMETEIIPQGETVMKSDVDDDGNVTNELMDALKENDGTKEEEKHELETNVIVKESKVEILEKEEVKILERQSQKPMKKRFISTNIEILPEMTTEQNSESQQVNCGEVKEEKMTLEIETDKEEIETFNSELPETAKLMEVDLNDKNKLTASDSEKKPRKSKLKEKMGNLSLKVEKSNQEDQCRAEAPKEERIVEEVTTKEATGMDVLEAEKVPPAEETPNKLSKKKKQKKVEAKAESTTKPKVIAKDKNARPKKYKKKVKDSKKNQSKAKSDASGDSEDTSIRRSSRIKSISVLKKKPSVGHGLVKTKSEDQTSENSNDSEKPTSSDSVSTIGQISDADTKPIKVKSRWRRSSELEMNNRGDVSGETTVATVQLSPVDEKPKVPHQDELVEARLKQFVHLKENLYLTERFTCKEAKKMICDCFLTKEEIERGEYGCGEDCLNRLLMIECGPLCPVGDRCTNKKFQKTQFAPVEVFNTEKKGLGLKAAANVPYGEFILEYVGEVLDPDEFQQRAEDYSKVKNQHYYFMSLRADAVIDATMKGNISRFINHSCDPNAETQKWTVNGELRIGFFSTRTILAGEEITFDYRFQRYGKEAQKCYCEASTCRGWLGEEPDEEDDEEEEEEEEEEAVEETEEAATSKDGKVQITESVEVSPAETTSENAEVKKDVEKPKVVKPKVRKQAKRKVRKELLEELDQLEEEIEMLMTTGLKNQAHTLKLSRLMVRAKEVTQRAKLLRVLRRGELPCRRLFLDYHGLRLMHGYMMDAQQLVNTDKKFDHHRLEILQTLAVLPIPNKTMLQDSKVLPTVENWANPADGVVLLDSGSNSPNVNDEPPKEESKKLAPEPIKVEPSTSKMELDPEVEDAIRRSVGMSDFKIENQHFTNTRGRDLADEIANEFEEDEEVIVPEKKPPLPNYEEEIIALAGKLLEEWSNLMEVFRIPKKERIEQMKEHEREANKGYNAALALEQYAEKRNEQRYRGLQKSTRWQDTPTSLKNKFPVFPQNFDKYPKISKHQRRKLFALQVEQQEEEERRRKQREFWRQHEKNCLMLGTDPRFTAPFDPNRGYQLLWNPQTGQWQNYPHPLPSPSQVYIPSPQGYNPSPQAYPQPPYNPSPQPPTSMQQIANLPNTSLPPPQLAQLQPPSQLVPPLPNQLPLSAHLPTNPQMAPLQIPNPQMVPAQIPPISTYPYNPITSTGVNLSLTGIAPPIPTNSSSIPGIPQTPPLPTSYQKAENEVKFLGPIPPPVKLPPKWKCAKDKYGRPYYYHVKIRKSQWEPPSLEPPALPPPEGVEDTSESCSSSESSSITSDSSTDNSDSDDDIDDAKLLREVRKQMEKTKSTTSKPSTSTANRDDQESITPSLDNEPLEDSESFNTAAETSLNTNEAESASLLDIRLKEMLNSGVLKEDKPPPSKRRRSNLVQEVIISPRTEEDHVQFKEDLKRYKANKEKLKRQKEMILAQKRRQDKRVKEAAKAKMKLREMRNMNTEAARKIKDNFRSSMANTVVSALNYYRRSDCKEGRITKTEDFKHLARKLTHFVMLKEMKHISSIEELVCSDNVKVKAREYIKKYMGKFGETYQKRDDEPDNFY